MKARFTHTLLVAVQHDVVFADASRYVVLAVERYSLGYLMLLLHHLMEGGAGDEGVSVLVISQVGVALFQRVGQELAQCDGGFLAHAIRYHVGLTVNEDAWTETLLPIVEVHHAPETGLDAAQYHRHIGIELPQNLGIDDGGVLWPHVVTAVGTVGIFASESSCGGVFVHHRVHAAGCNAEEQTWSSQALEVAVVSVPVGLRHYGHSQSLSLHYATYHRCSERRVIHIGIGAEEYHVSAIPAAQVHFASGGGEPIGQLVCACTQLSLSVSSSGLSASSFSFSQSRKRRMS